MVGEVLSMQVDETMQRSIDIGPQMQCGFGVERRHKVCSQY